jgi:hypothetical protein
MPTLDEYGYQHAGQAHVGHRASDCQGDRRLGYRTNAPAYMTNTDEYGYRHLTHSGMHVDHRGEECKRARELGYRPQPDPSDVTDGYDNRPARVFALILAALLIGVVGVIVWKRVIARSKEKLPKYQPKPFKKPPTTLMKRAMMAANSKNESRRDAH